MGNYIEPRLWLSEAKSLPVGHDTKIVHRGCGDRPSLFVKNDDDKYWCFCHRCHGGGFQEKTLQRVKQKLAQKTGWIPADIIPLVEAVVSEPYNFRETFERFGISKYVTLLKFARDTKRIYFPDVSGSFLGLDATGQANARFYSPLKRNVAVYHGNNLDSVIVSGSLEEYLSACKMNLTAILVMNRAGEKTALAELSKIPDAHVHTGNYLKDRFLRDLRMFKE